MVHCGGHVSGTVAGLMKGHPPLSSDDRLYYVHGGEEGGTTMCYCVVTGCDDQDQACMLQ